MSANIGWLFYRDYYEQTALLRLSAAEPDDTEQKKAQKAYFNPKNDRVHAAAFPDTRLLDLLNLPGRNEVLDLTTTYPGMIIGTGYSHETGLMGEIKIGFSFDHTTGLPILPGSSVKGILRSVFPSQAPNQPQRNQREYFLRSQLRHTGVNNATDLDLAALEDELFEGKRNGRAVPWTQCDVFGDAYPSKPATGGRFLGDDFITPHGKVATKNPNPLQLLRILPGVTFTFQFRLTDGLLRAEEKRALFKAILLHLGVGAKTNVGYGRFKAEPTPAQSFYNPVGLSLLPNLPPLLQPVPVPPRDSPGSPIPVEANQKKEFFAEADQSKYQRINEHQYFTGNPTPGVLLEAVPSVKNRAIPKQKTFRLFIGGPGQEVEIPLSYSDDSVVGKPCVVKISQVDKKTRKIQAIEFKAVL